MELGILWPIGLADGDDPQLVEADKLQGFAGAARRGCVPRTWHMSDLAEKSRMLDSRITRGCWVIVPGQSERGHEGPPDPALPP
jgi:hypothetical protein